MNELAKFECVSCKSEHIDELSRKENRVQLYCIECGSNMFWSIKYYENAMDNYIKNKLFKIQNIQNLNNIICKN